MSEAFCRSTTIAGHELQWFEEIGSTNSYLVAEVKRACSAGRSTGYGPTGSAGTGTAAGTEECRARRVAAAGSGARVESWRETGVPGLVAVADYQSDGRGRLDRRWEAPKGRCLLASIVLPELLAAQDLHLAVMATGLAVKQACEEVAGLGVDLVWPNDLYVGASKLAGCLAEAVAAGEHGVGPAGEALFAVVAGIGLNVSWPRSRSAGPSGSRQATSILLETGRAVSRTALLEGILAGIDAWMGGMQAAGWRERTVGGYRSRCVTLGRVVEARLVTGETVAGPAVDLDEDGCLVIDAGRTARRISSGDIVILGDAERRPEA